MLLSVLERIQLMNILPRESDFSTLKIVRNLQNDLSFSEEEHKTLDFKNGGETYIEQDEDGKPKLDKDGKPIIKTVPKGQIYWNKIEDKDVQIGEKATDIIKKAFKELNSQGKLNIGMIDLYEKFIKE